MGINILALWCPLLSDRGPSLICKVVDEMPELLGIGRLLTYPLHPQANGTVERWNRTVVRDLASFVSTGESDWNEHVALACFRYNSSVCEATGAHAIRRCLGIDALSDGASVKLDGMRANRQTSPRKSRCCTVC